MKAILTILACLTLSCVHTVNDSDRDAWRGAPLIDLETHPFFTRLPLEKRSLSNGDELWIFRNTESTITADCNDKPGGMDCEGKSGFRGCLNQFIVGGGIVKEYRPQPVNILFCLADCRLRPASRPCE